MAVGKTYIALRQAFCVRSLNLPTTRTYVKELEIIDDDNKKVRCLRHTERKHGSLIIVNI